MCRYRGYLCRYSARKKFSRVAEPLFSVVGKSKFKWGRLGDCVYCSVGVVDSDAFPYCKLHVLYAFQPKGQKEEVLNKDEELPPFIEKKIKSA